MMDKEILRSEAAHYRLLADQLKERFAAIDDETLQDTVEGLSDLPDMIGQIVRSGLDDEALIAGLKTRMEAMTARIARFKARIERKRELVAWAMGLAGLPRLEEADFTVFLRQAQKKLAIAEGAELPEIYLVPQPAKINRSLLFEALKAGTLVEGASLIWGEPHIAVRTT